MIVEFHQIIFPYLLRWSFGSYLLFYFDIMNLGWICNHSLAKTQQISSLLTKVKDFFLNKCFWSHALFQCPESRGCCFDLFYFIILFYYCFLEREFAVLIIQPFWKSFSTISSYYSLFDYLISVLNFPLLLNRITNPPWSRWED